MLDVRALLYTLYEIPFGPGAEPLRQEETILVNSDSLKALLDIPAIKHKWVFGVKCQSKTLMENFRPEASWFQNVP